MIDLYTRMSSVVVGMWPVTTQLERAFHARQVHRRRFTAGCYC